MSKSELNHINLWQIPTMLEDAEYDSKEFSPIECIVNALFAQDLAAFTTIKDDQYNPTGDRVWLEPTDWHGQIAHAAILTGTMEWPPNSKSSNRVQVFVEKIALKRWIKSVTGEAIKIQVTNDQITLCRKWLESLIEKGPKEAPKTVYRQISGLGPKPFRKAWEEARKKDENGTWSAHGPIPGFKFKDKKLIESLLEKSFKKFKTQNS